MSNRVEELEQKVSELQAAVNGLTEELVETKERVRQLEDVDGDAPETAEGDEAATVVEDAADGAEPETDAEADADSPGEVEAAKSDEAEEETESESVDDNDIIVA